MSGLSIKKRLEIYNGCFFVNRKGLDMSITELQSKVNRKMLAESIEQQMHILIGYRIYIWRWRYDKNLNKVVYDEYARELGHIENIEKTQHNPKLIRKQLLAQITEGLEFKNKFELVFGDRLEMEGLASFFLLVISQQAHQEKEIVKNWQGVATNFTDLVKSVHLLTRTGALRQAFKDFNFVSGQNKTQEIGKLFEEVLTHSQFSELDKLLEDAVHADEQMMTSNLFSWDLYELLEQRFSEIENLKSLGRDLADWFVDVWLPHMVKKLEWYHADPITSTGKNIYQALGRLITLRDQKNMIENTPVEEMLVSSDKAEKNKEHALQYIDQKMRYESIYFHHLVQQDDYFDKSQNSEDVMSYLELTEHEALRELLPIRVVDGKYEFMYSGYNVEHAKQDWAKIVERLEKITKCRAKNGDDSKSKLKRGDRGWEVVYMPKLPGESEE